MSPFTQDERENPYSGWLAKPGLAISTRSKKGQIENAAKTAPTTAPTTTPTTAPTTTPTATTLPSAGDSTAVVMYLLTLAF